MTDATPESSPPEGQRPRIDPRSVALVTHGICIRTLLLITTNDKINLTGHVYDNGNNAPTAGVWYGTRGENCWRWELAFRPAQS